MNAEFVSDTPEELVDRAIGLVENSETKRWYISCVPPSKSYRDEVIALCQRRGYAAELSESYILVSKP